MESYENILQNAQKLLGSDEKLLIEARRCDMEERDVYSNTKVFNQLKSQYTDVKYSLRDYQTRLFFLQSLETGEDSLNVTARDLKASSQQVQEVKAELMDLKIDREQIADSIDQLYPQYIEMRERLQKATQQLQDKIHQKANADKQEVVNQRKIEMKKKIEEMKAKVEAAKIRESKAKQKQETYQKQLSELVDRKNVLKSQSQSQEVENGIQQSLAWYDRVSSLLSSLSGVMLVSCDLDKMVLEVAVSSDQVTTVADHDGPLQVTVQTSIDPVIGRRLTRVQVNKNTLDVDDIIERGIGRNDLAYIITSLRDRWSRHLPLLTEVDSLRDRFALDFDSSSGLVTTIIGGDAANQVALRVAMETYPAAGSVSLVHSQHTQHLTPGSECATLTDWLEHLHQTLAPPTANVDR